MKRPTLRHSNDSGWDGITNHTGAAATTKFRNRNPRHGESLVAVPPQLHLKLPCRMHCTDLMVFSTFPAGEVASPTRIIVQYAAEHLAPARRYRKSCNAGGGGGGKRRASCNSVCGCNIFYNRILVHTRPNKKKVEGTHPPSLAPCVDLCSTSHMYPRTTPFLEHLTRAPS